MKASSLTRTLLISAVDLTRACAAQEHYCEWLARYSDILGGSAGVAHYLASAALALAEASHFPSVAASAAFAAHETLSDILMTSPPLSAAELQEAVRAALRDAQEDDTSLPDFSCLPSFHS